MSETDQNGSTPVVTKWGRIEMDFESDKDYENPIQEVALQVVFTSPFGSVYNVMGFWDGGRQWRVRFCPDEEGEWSYATFFSDAENAGLHNREGRFMCGPSATSSEFDVHGPVALSANRRHFIYADEKPFFYMEPAYENHVAYHSKRPHDAASVRKAMYWSLLNAPTAGVTYGGHGVWGWDDGSGPPVDHPNSGTPLPWHDALLMDGAEQVRYFVDAFDSIGWWKLRPAPELLGAQPGREDVHKHILISKSVANDLVVAYTPQGEAVEVKMAGLSPQLRGIWYNPRDGDVEAAEVREANGRRIYEAPGDGDWLLVLA